MSNIYLTIDKIEALLSKNSLILSERNFLELLLYGDKAHPGLIDLARHGTSASFQILEQKLLTYISLIPIYKYYYKLCLNSIYEDISLLRKLTNDEIKSQQIFSSPKAFAQYAILRDEIYHFTHTLYSGRIMLPIVQNMDYRLGNSKGECSGYVAEWIQSFLHGKRPFGISFLGAPPFQPILLSSKTGKKYPELNHCAPLTKNIATLQKLNFRLISKGLDYSIQGAIYQQNEGGVVLKQDAGPLAKYLLDLSQRNPNSGFYLSLRNYINGHALGFYKDTSGNFHFLDVNTAWYRFNKAEEFISWLCFYFDAMNYHKKYTGCEIFSFGFQKQKVTLFKNIGNASSFFAKREGYLLKQRLSEAFRFFHSSKPTQKQRPFLANSFSSPQNTHSQDDSQIKSTRLHDHDAILASLVDIEEREFYKSQQRALQNFRPAL